MLFCVIFGLDFVAFSFVKFRSCQVNFPVRIKVGIRPNRKLVRSVESLFFRANRALSDTVIGLSAVGTNMLCVDVIKILIWT